VGELVAIWAAAAVPVVVVALRWGFVAREASRRRTFRLSFAYGTEPGQVVAFWRSVSGLLPPWWKRWRQSPALVLQTSADASGISHFLTVAAGSSEYVLAQLRATLPGVRIEPVDAPGPDRLTVGAELRASSFRFALRADDPQNVAAGVLATLQPLGGEEAVVVQWVISPAPASAPPRASALDVLGVLGFDDRGRSLRRLFGELAAEREKNAEPAVWAVCRIGARSASVARARRLVRRIEGALHATSDTGVSLRRRWLPEQVVVGRIARGAVPAGRWPMLLNAKELAAVAGVPIGELTLPGLSLAGARQLAPSPVIPGRGRVVGRATFPGTERAVALSVADSLRHLHVVGPTGVGKSTLLLNLICGDLAAGRGVVVVDPKGDLVVDVLDRLPAGRVDDVVLLDPTDVARPVGFNVLAQAGSPELAADQVVAIFRHLFAAFWGPRTDDVLRAALLTLLGRSGMTLAEVPLLLTDERFRRRFTGALDDHVLEGFWAWYEALSPGERAQVVGPVLNKLRTFLLRRRLRNVVGQSESTFSLEAILANRGVLLVSLSKGVLGTDAAALLGAAILAALWQAVQARAALPAAERTPVFCYVDEFQDYLRLPTDLADVLAQARGYGLGLTLAHQHLGQLPAEVRHAVLANARSRVVFQTAAGDARLLAREFAPYLTPTDLQGLGPFEAVLAASSGGRVLPPTTIATLPAPEPTGYGEAARARSRQRYGRDATDVEAALRSRTNGQSKAVTVGSRRRP